MTRGEFIAAMRQKKGLSAEELAAKLKVSADTVREWEEGALPDSEYILPLAEALDIPAEDILKEEKEESYYEKLNRKMGYPQVPKSPNYNPEERGSNGYFRAERIIGYVIMSLFMLYVVIFFGRELSSWLNRPRALTLENCAEIVEIEVDPANGTVIDGKYTASIRVNRAVHDFEITFILKFYSVFQDSYDPEEPDIVKTLTKRATYVRENETLEVDFGVESRQILYTDYEITAVSGELE